MKTKISWILLGLVCGSAYAAHGEETPLPVSNDINVTAPHQTGTWSFGAEAVLLQPMNQTFTYADLRTPGAEDAFPQRDSYQDVNPGYHGWFGADITYGFAGNGRDVTLAYEGLQGNDTAHAVGTDAIPLYSDYYGDQYDTAKGETQINYDAADLVFGQKLNVGQRISLHPFMGLRYAYIQEKNTVDYTATDDGTTSTLQETWKASFNGIGPRFGSNATINLGQGFSVRGQLGLSALIASTKPDFYTVTQLYAADGVLAVTDNYSADYSSSTHVIPEIDGKLGLNYTYNFDSNMALGVEAGWQASNYFNALYQVEESEIPNSTNFGLQGPYARLQLDIT